MGRQTGSQGIMAEPNHSWVPFPNVGRLCAVPHFRKEGEHKIDLQVLMP